MPRIGVVYLAPILLAVIFLSETALSWTAPIIISTKIATKSTCPCFDSSKHREYFPQATKNPFSSFGAKPSPSAALCSTNSYSDGDVCANEASVEKSNIENNYSNSTGTLLISNSEDSDERLKEKGQKVTSMPTSKSPLAVSAIKNIVIVLNTNAKGVTEDMVEEARDVAEHWEIQRKIGKRNIPKTHLIVTSTYNEARSASRDIMSTAKATSATTMVIPVGGDGTLTTMINLLWEEHSTNSIENQAGSSDDIDFPILFGYIAMGTGNALGSVVGCSPMAKCYRKRERALRFFRRMLRPRVTKRKDFGLVISQLIETAMTTQTVEKQLQNEGKGNDSFDIDVLELPLIRVRTYGIDSSKKAEIPNDQYAFFAGLGYDSLLLQDYKDMQDWTKSRKDRWGSSLWQTITTGVVGYTVAMVTQSLPKLLKLKDASVLLRDVKITTDDPESAYWIDHRRGDMMRPAISDVNDNKAQEGLLYRGSAGIVAAGTVPFYGGGLRLFPFAQMTPSGMHLRIARRLHPLEGVSKIPLIFQGSYRDKTTGTFKCLDFVGNQFSIEIYESYNCNEGSTSRQQTEEGFPVQHSGETLGRCTRVEFAVSKSPFDCQGSNDLMPPPMRFVSLVPPRIVEERNID